MRQGYPQTAGGTGPWSWGGAPRRPRAAAAFGVPREIWDPKYYIPTLACTSVSMYLFVDLLFTYI